jgi:hypothetical protein
MRHPVQLDDLCNESVTVFRLRLWSRQLDAESSILANKADDHTKNVFDPSVRGHTDQFLFRFKKPN